MTLPGTTPIPGDPLAPFRDQQEKEASRGPRYGWSAAVLLVVSLAGGVWIFTDFAGRNKGLVPSVGMGAFFFLVVWVMGTMTFPSIRPRKARTKVEVTGRDLTLSRDGSIMSALPMLIFFAIITVGMLWVSFAELLGSPRTQDQAMGWLCLFVVALVFILVIPMYLLPELGPTRLQLTGTTLQFRVGKQSSFTVQLNRHSLPTVLVYRGQHQLSLMVYPPAESRVFGLRKRRRSLVIPGTSFPEMSMHVLADLMTSRRAEGSEVAPKVDYEVVPRFQPRTTSTAVVVLALLAVATVVLTGCDPLLATLGALVLFLPVTGVNPRGSILRPELSGGPRGWAGPWQIRCDYPWLLLGPLMAVLVLVIAIGIRGLLASTPNDSLGWLLLIAGAVAPLTVWGYQAVGACVLTIDEEVLHIRLGHLVRARVTLADISTAEVDTVLWHRVRIRSEGRIHLRLLGSDFDVSTVTLPAPFIHGVDTRELAALLIDRSTEARRVTWG